MNNLIFNIISLLEYNNETINNLSKQYKLLKNNNYKFNITQLKFLNYIKYLNYSSNSFLSEDIPILSNSNSSFSDIDEKILDSDEELSTYSDEELSTDSSYNSNLSTDSSYNSNLSINSYNSNLSTNSYNSNLSIGNDEELSIDSSYNSNLSTNNIELVSLSTNSNFEDNDINFHNIYNILKLDYEYFYNYYTLINNIKYKNLSLYKELNNLILFINLESINNDFLNLIKINKIR